MEPQQSHPSTTSPPATARLTLKPTSGVRGFVDGAWWPRSTNPTTEFTALLAALTTENGHVNRLAYNLTAWEPAPRKIDVRGHQVRLEGFHHLDRRTVAVTGSGGLHKVLLVVPPDTTAPGGDAVLATAADRDNAASPGELLAEARTPSTTGVTSSPRPAETAPEASWETDGGHLLVASRA